MIDSGGAWTAGTVRTSAAVMGMGTTDLTNCVNDFLHLAAGDAAGGSGGTYASGKFVIKLYGASF
jgi:hypothetical protein